MTTLTLPFRQAHDGVGAAAPLAELYTFESGTAIPKPVYADRALEVPLPNPVVADEEGRFPRMYGAAGLYYLVLRTASPAPDQLGEVLAEEDEYELLGAGLPEAILDALAAIGPAASGLAALSVLAEAGDLDALSEAVQNPASNLNKAASLGSVDPEKITAVADNIAAIKALPKNASLGDYDVLVSGNTPITSYNDTFTTESGSRRWTPKHSLALPFTPSGSFVEADWQELLGVSEVTAIDFNAMLKRLRRLETYHPSTAPQMDPIPNRAVEEATSGTLLDLSGYVTDGDSIADDLTFSVTGLPAGYQLVGGEIQYAAPSIASPASVTVTVTDESGLTASQSFTIETYATGVPPTAAPKFGAIADITVVKGNDIPARDHKGDVIDPDSTTGQLAVAASFNAASGMTITDGQRAGVADEVGAYPVSLTVTDQDSNEDTASYTLTVEDAPPPVLTAVTIPFVYRSSPPVVFDHAPSVSDANTPDEELVMTLTGAPSGTLIEGLVSTLPAASTGIYTVTRTITNRAGKSESDTFQFSVFDPPRDSGGGGGGGGGVRYDVYLA